MIVVADTSPIRYLVLIEQIDLLPILFDRVIIPPAVYGELKSLGAPIVVRKWIAHPPTWLTVETLQNPSIDYVGLDRLHRGESEAIFLALQFNANLIILDEKAARRIAVDRGLKVTGLLGIIEIAARQNLIDVPAIVQRLQDTNFRIAPRLLQSLLERYSRPIDLNKADQ
jgi:predicted nucleic acid-binding protein